MAYKVLYRKYRPTDFDNVVGQEYTVKMLKNAITMGKSSHAYLFTGPRGTGKTSTAKIFSKALNCLNPKDGNPCNECSACLSFGTSPDIIELDAASNSGVDDIREIISNAKLVPSELKYKIYIIDEVHMLSTGAFNALLLTLEEPPEHVVFILATTEIQKVPITILSRCQRFDFKPINSEDMIDRLKKIAKLEKIKITDEALEEISMISAGGMRDALGILDQLSSNDVKIDADMVSSNFGTISRSKIEEIVYALDELNVDKLLELLNNVEQSGTNYNVFLDKMVQVLRDMAIKIKQGKDFKSLYYEDIYNMICDINDLLSNISINVNPYLLIEIVLLKYIKNNNLLTGKGNKNYFPGNNLSENSVDFENKKDKKESLGNNLGNNLNDSSSLGNNLGNNFSSEIKPEKSLGNNSKKSKKALFSVETRINNCFVEASKEIKKDIANKWIDFMNYLISVDRNVISLIADTEILAASNKYVLIHSANEATNSLINQDIAKIEKYFNDYYGSYIRFAAVEDNLWQKEKEKCRINLKNNIKYNYIEEDISYLEVKEESIKEDDIESVAKEIFDSYTVIE